MSNRKAEAAERAARVAQVRAEQERSERRQKRLIIGGAVALSLGLVAAAAVPLVNAQRDQAALAEATAGDVEGVEEYTDLSAEHVTTAVDYAPTPPVGGDHHPTWLNCGIYDEEVPQEHAVHSLEHGAVWITYRPDLPQDQLDTLVDLVEGESYAILSPVADLGSPVVASAWGLQLAVEDAGDDRLPVFLAKYLQGEQTPEPGAACFGGTGTPA